MSWVIHFVYLSIIISLLFIISRLWADAKWFKTQWLGAADALFKAIEQRDRLGALVQKDIEKDLIRSEFEANC